MGAVLAVLTLLLSTATPHAASPNDGAPIVLSAGTNSVSLAGHLGLLVDREGTLDLSDAMRAASRGGFKPLPGFAGAGHTRDVHWYRFRVLRRDGTSPLWVLAMGSPYIDHIDVFITDPNSPDGRGIREYRTGDFVPYSQRPVRSHLLPIPLLLPADQVVSVYVRIQSVSAITFSGAIWKPEPFLADTSWTLILQGIFQGALAIVIVFYAFLGVMLVDGALISYTLYVLTLFDYYLFANGLAVVLLPDMPGWLINLMTGGTSFAGAAAAMFMWDRLLNLRVTFPRLHRVYMIIAGVELLTVPSAATSAYITTNSPLVLLAELASLLSLTLVFILMRRNPSDVSLRYYFVAFVTAISGLIVSQLAIHGAIPVNWLTENSYQLASAAHVIILGLGLSHRVRRMQNARIQAEQEARFAHAHAAEQRSFLAMLSHEFRTPLASIDSAAQLIEAREPDLAPPSRDRLNRIRSVSRRLCDLVDLFLSSEALDQGALALQPEPVDLHAFLESVLDQIMADDPTAPVDLSVTPDAGTVRFDPQFMTIALSNLILNALRYSPEGEPVAVRATVGTSGVRIAVSDRGYGMTPAEVDRIGAMYFRAASSQGTEGVGIGLYITKKIIVAHGGALDVASEPGEGTTFTIRLTTAVG